MLYILAGASNSGKSQLARRITEEYNIPHFPLDLLTSIFSETKTIDISHASTVEERAKALWKFTLPMSTHLISEVEKYLLEGDALLPNQATHLQKEHSGKVKACFLGYAEINPEKKLKMIREFEYLPDSWTQNFTDKQVLDFIQKRIEFSQFLKKECKKFNLPYIEVGEDLGDMYTQILTCFNLK